MYRYTDAQNLKVVSYDTPSKNSENYIFEVLKYINLINPYTISINMTLNSKELVVTKDSNGDFMCPVCGKFYLQEAIAFECLESHEGDRDVLVLDRVRALASPVNTAFGNFDGSANTVGVNERLVSFMFEDYLLSREQDIVGRGKVSPLSMQLSKNLNDAVTNLNKLKYGTKSLSVKVTDNGPTDAMDILAEVITVSDSDEDD